MWSPRGRLRGASRGAFRLEKAASISIAAVAAVAAGDNKHALEAYAVEDGALPDVDCDLQDIVDAFTNPRTSAAVLAVIEKIALMVFTSTRKGKARKD